MQSFNLAEEHCNNVFHCLRTLSVPYNAYNCGWLFSAVFCREKKIRKNTKRKIFLLKINNFVCSTILAVVFQHPCNAAIAWPLLM